MQEDTTKIMYITYWYFKLHTNVHFLFHYYSLCEEFLNQERSEDISLIFFLCKYLKSILLMNLEI